MTADPKKMAFYGGTFDPPHIGHIEIAKELTKSFKFDEFWFIPAFQAPHKKDRKPTSAFYRFAMLCLASDGEERLKVSKIEVEQPERPYTIETLARLKEKYSSDEIFFVMGADSWADITTWRNWEDVLMAVNIVVVTRPGVEISFDHVTEKVRSRIVDLRGRSDQVIEGESRIYISDCVMKNVSATKIREQIANGENIWRSSVNEVTARFIDKFKLYKND